MSFAPVYDDRSRALILGTWPSPKSREMAFYYGHPQNRFWPLLAALTGEPLPVREDIAAKSSCFCATGWRCGIRWKAAPSPAHRMPPSGMWCPTISPGCCAKHPSGRCSATVPQLTVSTQISAAAYRHPGCPSAQYKPRQRRLQPRPAGGALGRCAGGLDRKMMTRL